MPRTLATFPRPPHLAAGGGPFEPLATTEASASRPPRADEARVLAELGRRDAPVPPELAPDFARALRELRTLGY